MSTISNKVLVLFGPTAVGKTATIERLAQDDRLPLKPVVVVSADSVQVYRGLDIGSAKPGAAERATIRHELVDIIDPTEPFSVGEFVRLADEACERACGSGALPVLSGGTAYYVKAFLYGAPPAPPSDPAVRAAIQRELALKGPEALRQELREVDPASAGRIAPADLYRTTRAIEVYRCSGRPLSTYELASERRARWDSLVIGLDRPRAELYSRVDARVDAMMARGLPAEVESLVNSGLKPGDPGMKAIGYAEFLGTGNTGDWDLASISGAIKLNTRRYAKRQLTFMRGIEGVRWFGADDYDGVVSALLSWFDA